MSSAPTTAQRPSKPPPADPAAFTLGSEPGHIRPIYNPAYLKPHSNGAQKGKKKADLPVDPQAMYESLKSKIAALEEELIHADEEEERFGNVSYSCSLCHSIDSF